MENKKQVLAIGLEAAEIDLILKWTKEGHLPYFSKLLENGAWRKLESSTEVSSGSTWASLITGVSPAKHGMAFYHRQLKSGSYKIVKKYADEIAYPLFWKKLSDTGKRVAVLDIPDIYPIKNLNGIQMIGWGAEGLNFKQCTTPPELLSEIFAKFGHHPLEGWYQKVITDVDEWKSLMFKLIDGVKTRTNITKWLMEKEAWDFFLIGFAEMHWAGHYFWHLLDEKNPRFKKEVAEACGDAILNVYKEIDKSLKELIEIYPGALTLIISNTGMGPNYSGQHLIPDILKKLGMSGSKNGNGKISVADRILPAKKWGPYAIKRVESLVSAEMIEKIKKVFPEKTWDSFTRTVLTLGNKWKDSKAFMVPTDFSGSITINLRGREPKGIVNPGEDYDNLCNELETAFLELVNPDTGEKAVEKVIKVKDKYHGKNIDDLPDIIIKWVGKDPIRTLTSERIGTVTGEIPDNRSGAHMTYGFLIVLSKNLKRAGRFEDRYIEDVAPTIFDYYGISIPDDMDGKSLKDMFID